MSCPSIGTGTGSYRKETPYCATDSNPDFQTRVTSHEFVACNRQDKKAETAFPPTTQTLISDRPIVCD